MDEDTEKDEAEEPDDSEEKFFERIKAMQRSALDEWAAELSADIDEEEEQKPTKVEFVAKKKAAAKAKPEETETEDATEGVQSDEPSPAERSRAAGRVGPAAPSGYWERVGHRLLYGNRRR